MKYVYLAQTFFRRKGLKLALAMVFVPLLLLAAYVATRDIIPRSTSYILGEFAGGAAVLVGQFMAKED